MKTKKQLEEIAQNEFEHAIELFWDEVNLWIYEWHDDLTEEEKEDIYELIAEKLRNY